jgi:hypothetical protein
LLCCVSTYRAFRIASIEIQILDTEKPVDYLSAPV